MINPVADVLAVPHSDIYANNLLFAADGGYAGFDEKELPLALTLTRP